MFPSLHHRNRGRGLAMEVFVAAGFSIVCILVFWALLPERFWVPENSDYASFYEPVARMMLEGRGAVLPDGSVAVRYPPGHPMIIASTFAVGQKTGIGEAVAVRLLILMCFALTSAFLYLVARDVWGGWLGLLAPLAFSTYPFAVWLSREPHSEVTFLPALAATVWLYWLAVRSQPCSGWKFFLCGAVAGFSMLIRPAGIGLGIVLFGVTLVYSGLGSLKTRVAVGGCLLAGVFVVVVPWEAHVFSKTGHVIPLSSGGASSMLDGLTFAVRDKAYRRQKPIEGPVADYMVAMDRRFPPGSRKSGVVEGAVTEAGKNPGGAALLAGWKSIRCWYATDSQRYDHWAVIIQIPYLVLLAVASAISFRRRGSPRRLAILTTAILVYFWIVTVAVLSILRYTVPAICIAFVVLPAIFALRSGDGAKGQRLSEEA